MIEPAAAADDRTALLFDVDGTLADTLGAGKAAIGRAMEQVYGETGPLDEFDFHGRTDPEIVRGLLRAAGREDRDVDPLLSTLWPVYLERLAAELDALDGSARPLPGVRLLLERLAGDDRFACGLVTGNLREGARLKLAAIGIDGSIGPEGPFTFGGFGCDAEARDELPTIALARARRAHGPWFPAPLAVVIGDTPADIRCARAGGTRVLAVATGRHSPAELRRHAPDAVFPDLSDTDRVLDFLLATRQPADA